MDYGKILIEAYFESNQIRSNSYGNVDRGCGIDAGLCGIYCYLTGTDWEVMWLGVGLREGGCVIF